MTDETLVTIEVDGRELKAKPGSMLIDVTDAAGITIPRFCYHKKLSISANCRMCLVEVERAPKPLPACATPVNDGMKVYTKSPLALAAQKGTMEFLLINHPLDCPICDQGGECELQDVALGYGSDASRYVEAKRIVSDPDIGPLVATDMTRCIHCTRCVRFGAEIAGIREMGATGRGEHMKIGTYIQKSVDSELSGNIIDLCPVGALTSKPFRFQARAWELNQTDAISPHDGVGSNLSLHVRRSRALRVVPRDNETLNECWISDRDRFSYDALYSEARLERPMVKVNEKWQTTSWDDALKQAAKALNETGDSLSTLVSPNATLEELYLAQKLTRGMGSKDIDYRLRQSDFRNDVAGSVKWLGMPIADIDHLQSILLVGANPRKDLPIIGHRLRQAALEGASISYVNPLTLDLNYEAQQLVDAPSVMVKRLESIAKALGIGGNLVSGAVDDEECKAVAEQLRAGERKAVLLGAMAMAHPDFAIIEQLADKIAAATSANFGYLLEGANSVGAQLAGASPLHSPGGKAVEVAGRNSEEIQSSPVKGALLLAVDPLLDSVNPIKANASLAGTGRVVALTAFRTQGLEQCADIMLPIGWFAETSGTYVNLQGDWQSVAGAIPPAGEARPAWKVLRVLGNMTDTEGFDYTSSDEIRNELKDLCADVDLNNTVGDTDAKPLFKEGSLTRIGAVNLYHSDYAVRNSAVLQQTKDAQFANYCRMNIATASAFDLTEGDRVMVQQGGVELNLPVAVDAGIPDDCIAVAAGIQGSGALGPVYGEITLEKE